MNLTGTMRKMMGWCPNVNALATKRVMVALPEGEDFFADEKGKGGMNMSKMGWGNKFRNIALLMTLISFAFLGFFMLFIHEYSDFGEYLSKSFIKGILTAIILAIIPLAHHFSCHDKHRVYYLFNKLPYDGLLGMEEQKDDLHY